MFTVADYASLSDQKIVSNTKFEQKRKELRPDFL